MSESSKNKMQAVLNYINEYNAEYGYSPTVREICAIAGKTVFMYRGEYEAVRSAPAYRALFDNNTVRAIEG